jgi:hypothetical protein
MDRKENFMRLENKVAVKTGATSCTITGITELTLDHKRQARE